jgi:beta-mannanase
VVVTDPAGAPHPVEWGVYVPDDGAPSSDLDTVEAMAGDVPDFVLRFAAIDEPVPLAQLTAIADGGSTPMVTLEPWIPGAGVEQPDYSLARIAAGDHDTALRRWATTLADWHRPVLLRFAHEMNSTWYPWSIGSNGNTAADYPAAWRHVHDVFRSAGADQVSFVWAPNVPFSGDSATMQSVFPGPDTVDAIGIDGYNWGEGDGHHWQPPADLLGPGLHQLRQLPGDLPILVTETASAEGPQSGTDKATWISQLVDYLVHADRVTGFIWFQADKERDWRLNSTEQSQAAFRNALAGRPAA